MRWNACLLVAFALTACDPSVADDETEDASTGGSPATSEGPDPSTTLPATSDGSTGVASTTTGGSSTGSSGDSTTSTEGSTTGSESSSSGGGFGQACDPYAQDCPEGQKCNAWADGGGAAWNALGCFPVVDEPGQPGEACTADGATSGFDTCDVGSMCWEIDPVSGEGTCTAMCGGTPETPTCEASATCSMFNGGVLNLCLPGCDPLAQNCDPGQGCYPLNGGFVCGPDASGGNGAGVACMFANTCAPGHACISGAAYGPGCSGEGPGCCTAFCELPTETCALETHECLPWFNKGAAPPGLEDVGVCVAPS